MALGLRAVPGAVVRAVEMQSLREAVAVTDVLMPFQLFGSKATVLEWIHRHLPANPRYVEPFCGTATVLLNRPRVETETLNDINGSIVTFFRVLRERTDDLVAELETTPHSRQEYERASAIVLDDVDPETGNEPTDFRVAWAQYVAMSQVVGGTKPTPGRWGYGVGERPIVANSYFNRLEDLPAIAERLKAVQVEHLPATDVMERYDTPETTQYLDPPYPGETRAGAGNAGYSHELTTDDHRELLELAKSLDSDVTISTYPNDLYDSELEDWFTAERSTRTRSHNTHNRQRKAAKEVLYMNFEPGTVPVPTTHGQQATLATGGDPK